MAITRRDVLAHGGKAIAAAAVLPFLPSIAHAEDDAALFAQYEKCRRLDRAHLDALGKARLARFAVKKEQRLKIGWSPNLLWTPDWTLKLHPQNESADLAEAEERAGIPALDEKAKAAGGATAEAWTVFFNMRARTPLGMALKIQMEWSKVARLITPQAKSAAPSSLLLDLERLSGRLA